MPDYTELLADARCLTDDVNWQLYQITGGDIDSDKVDEGIRKAHRDLQQAKDLVEQAASQRKVSLTEEVLEAVV